MSCTVRRQIKSELKEPTKIRKIDGDGNCLFRALSAEITNSQDHHKLIKNALVTFMTSDRGHESYLLKLLWAGHKSLGCKQSNVTRGHLGNGC